MSKFEVCALYVLSFEIVRAWKAINIFSDISILLFFGAFPLLPNAFMISSPDFVLTVRRPKRGRGEGKGEEETRSVGLHFFSSIKLLWRVFGTVSERNTTIAWSFRVHYGTANQCSFRFEFCQISFPSLPLPSPPPPSPFFVLELPKRDLGTRSPFVFYMGKVVWIKQFLLFLLKFLFLFFYN